VVGFHARPALALLCLVVACEAGEKPAPPAAAKPSANKVTVVAEPSLKYLPADSDIVVQADLRMLRKSALWTTYADDVAKLIVPGFTGCEYKLLADATSASIAATIITKNAVYVLRGVDRDKALRCLRTRAPGPWTARFDGDFVEVKSSSATYMLTFVDDTTLVMQGPTQPTKATLTQVVQTGSPLAHDVALAVPMQKLPKAAVTVVSRPGSEAVAAQWKAMGVHFKYFFGTMDATDKLALRFAMALQSADEATQLTTMMQGQVKQLKTMFERIEPSAQGEITMIDMGMTQAQLASIAGMMRGMQGAQ
jgi:hypothetical protein